MKPNEQLAKWVNGESIHNKERDECCPDFSCCNPDVTTPAEERVKFLNASESERHGMLFGFLGKALMEYSKTDKKETVIRLIGSEAGEQSHEQ